MENPIKMDDLGGNTPIFGLTPISLRKIMLDKVAVSQGRLFARAFDGTFPTGYIRLKYDLGRLKNIHMTFAISNDFYMYPPVQDHMTMGKIIHF